MASVEFSFCVCFAGDKRLRFQGATEDECDRPRHEHGSRKSLHPAPKRESLPHPSLCTHFWGQNCSWWVSVEETEGEKPWRSRWRSREI